MILAHEPLAQLFPPIRLHNFVALSQHSASHSSARRTQNNSSVELGKDNVKPEFLAKNPTGKLPFLETPHGVLFESSAIARYVARIRRDTELLGKSFFEAGQVRVTSL